MRVLLLTGLWCCSLLAGAAPQPDPFPQVARSYLVEVDGEVLWEKQTAQRLPPASLTKLMTVLLVLEQNQLQTTVNIGKAATRETGSRLHLKKNERFLVQDLLAATLMQSANDACHALADHVLGSEAAFVKLMNRRAQELGLSDTHFQNACGHDAPRHLSTATDLARLAHELLKHPEVITITSQTKSSITSTEGNSYKVSNKNALIGRYPGALGLKTGYTPSAGKCLIAYAKRKDKEVLLVMLHGQDRWWDAVDILDLAFEHATHTP